MTDPTRVEVLQEVVKLLGKPQFTPDEMMQLEREGKLPKGTTARIMAPPAAPPQASAPPAAAPRTK